MDVERKVILESAHLFARVILATRSSRIQSVATLSCNASFADDCFRFHVGFSLRDPLRQRYLGGADLGNPGFGGAGLVESAGAPLAAPTGNPCSATSDGAAVSGVST